MILINKSTKFYRKNEAEVMEMLGLKETSNSGAGWIEKGDGQNEAVLAELKSTDKTSFRVTRDDLNKVRQHALVANKIPMFVIQFFDEAGIGDIWIMVKPSHLQEIGKYLRTGKHSNSAISSDLVDWAVDVGSIQSQNDAVDLSGRKVIKSSVQSREELRKSLDNQWKKDKKSAT